NWDQIYVQNLNTPHYRDYYIYRKGGVFVDPDTRQTMGQSAIYMGKARLVRYRPGAPATMAVSDAKQELQPGDRLLIVPPLSTAMDFFPAEPNHKVVGHILGNLSAGSAISQYDVVIINLGAAQNIQRGEVLAIYQPGAVVPDPIPPERTHWYKRAHTVLVQL